MLRRRPNPERKTTWLSKTKLYKEENHFEIQRKRNFCKVEKIRCDTFSQSYVNGLKRAGEQMVEVTNPGIQTFPFFSLNFLFFMHFKFYVCCVFAKSSMIPPGQNHEIFGLEGTGGLYPPQLQDLGIQGSAFLRVFAILRPLSALLGPGSETLCCCSRWL